MKPGDRNNIYYPTAAQQLSGLAQQAQLNHGYHTRSAAAHLAPGVAGPGSASAAPGGYRGSTPGAAPGTAPAARW
jgi:hypothetical protein